jgi:hypothetical protein
VGFQLRIQKSVTLGRKKVLAAQLRGQALLATKSRLTLKTSHEIRQLRPRAAAHRLNSSYFTDLSSLPDSYVLWQSDCSS